MTQTKSFDVVSFIMDFESGECDEDQIIDGFQHLIDSGAAWSLQGSYGRTAHALIEAGHCTDPSVSRIVAVAKPEKVGTHCECGAAYVYLESKNLWGYGCAR